MRTLAPLLIGCCFGWLLHKARLGRYETVVNVFLFRDLTVLKFLMSALMVSALGIQALSLASQANQSVLRLFG